MTQRLVPLSQAVAALMVVLFSRVPPSLVVADGTLALVGFVAYVAVLLWIVADPDSLVAHLAGVVLATITTLSRAWPFLELVLDGRADLTAAVAERWALLVLLVSWHADQAARIGLRVPAERVREASGS